MLDIGVGGISILISSESFIVILPELVSYSYVYIIMVIYWQVNSEYAAGRMSEAVAASQTAKTINIISVILGTMINVSAVIAIIVFAAISA